MRPENHVPLTLEEHRELGREMRAANARLRQLCALVVDVYGPDNRAAFSFLKTLEAIDRLCHDLQAQAGQDASGMFPDDIYL
jgi:hypothetical protein